MNDTPMVTIKEVTEFRTWYHDVLKPLLGDQLRPALFKVYLAQVDILLMQYKEKLEAGEDLHGLSGGMTVTVGSISEALKK